MTKPLNFAAIGIDHRHIFGMSESMIEVGAEFVGWWTAGSPPPLDGFIKRFPDVPRVTDVETLLADPSIDLILISCVPADRAAFAVRAMRAGKDVMTDKPGCTTLDQLDAIKTAQKATGRIWSVNFSERFEVASMTRAAELVAAGAIGKVIQTTGLGPHRLNAATRPDWFWQRDRYGGILCDIGSHQIDQFLFLTGQANAEIKRAYTANYANPDHPELEDYGEIVLQAGDAHGFIRVDWYTPDALPTWGDGRLTILGTEGYIELRKYVDVARDETGDHLYLVNGDRCEKIDCSVAGRPYFARLSDDIRNRTDTAVPQAHTFKAMELAIKAQMLAEEAK
ncbi:Gfo/Idh/MocA family oxidoreductase [Rhodobacteraceae bacterium S2214]|nr:Gfo/Idh/MocA family oxidoreductase [Rhodobacteraceae bacterium S2214]